MEQGIPEGDLAAIEKANLEELEAAYKKSKSAEFKSEEWESTAWDEIVDHNTYGTLKDTGVPVDILQEMGNKISVLPENENFHPQIRKLFEARNKSILDGKGIDYGTAEALAFASLINEGHHVRLSGQDVERGTFSHRHHVLHHQTRDKSTFKPLANLYPDQVPYHHVSDKN